MAEPTLFPENLGNTESAETSSQNEAPKRRRKGSHKITPEKLEERVQEMPVSTYQATDDDLPVSLWPEPEF
jgi:hypothetical protein